MTAPFPGPQGCAARGTHCPCRELVPIPPCCGLTLDTLPAGPDSVVAEGEAWDCSQCWFGALTQLGSTSSASTGLGEVVSSAERWRVQAGFPRGTSTALLPAGPVR